MGCPPMGPVSIQITGGVLHTGSSFNLFPEPKTMKDKQDLPTNPLPNAEPHTDDHTEEEGVSEKATKTVTKQHLHDGPETRNTENRGRTPNSRGK